MEVEAFSDETAPPEAARPAQAREVPSRVVRRKASQKCLLVIRVIRCISRDYISFISVYSAVQED
jgi:hypothetical protein